MEAINNGEGLKPASVGLPPEVLARLSGVIPEQEEGQESEFEKELLAELEEESSLSSEERLAATIKKLSAGYTRLPNAILMDIVSGKLSKGEIVLVLLLARLTIGFQMRPYASLSKRAICRYTGLQGKTILQVVKSLIDKGYVFKIAGNMFVANKLRLVFDLDQFWVNEKFKRSETLPDSGGNSAVSKPEESSKLEGNCTQGEDRKSTHPQGKKSTRPQDQKNAHYKYTFSVDILKSLSSDSNAKEIVDYFSKLKAPEKLNTEWNHFQTLRERTPIIDIGRAYRRVRDRGILGSGQKCHSPMAYLGRAMDDVLAEIGHSLTSNAKSQDNSSSVDQTRSKLAGEGEQVDQIYLTQRAAFYRQFSNPAESQSYLKKCASEKELTRFGSTLFESLAIQQWAAQNPGQWSFAT